MLVRALLAMITKLIRHKTKHSERALHGPSSKTRKLRAGRAWPAPVRLWWVAHNLEAVRGDHGLGALQHRRGEVRLHGTALAHHHPARIRNVLSPGLLACGNMPRFPKCYLVSSLNRADF